jgi:hypothetical protein
MSVANIDQFLQNGLRFNGARPSRFLCSVDVPVGLAGFNSDVSRFKFMCKSASIPSSDVGVVSVPYFGRILKYSGDRVWQDWEASVLLDEDYGSRTFLEAWSNGINKLEDNTMNTGFAPNGTALGNDITPYGGYKATIDITHFSQTDNGTDGKVIANYKLIGAWPANIGPLQLAWEKRDSISEFSVKFAYDNCLRDTTLYDVGSQTPVQLP